MPVMAIGRKQHRSREALIQQGLAKDSLLSTFNQSYRLTLTGDPSFSLFKVNRIVITILDHGDDTIFNTFRDVQTMM